MLTRECNNGFVRAVTLCKALVDGVVIFDAARDAGGRYHRTGFAVYLLMGNHLLVEVVYHHSRFF